MGPGLGPLLVAVDPATGNILALVGGRDSARSAFNRASRSKRQPGSAFKPFVYAAALDSGKFTAATIVNDAPEVYDLWKPKNYKTGAFEGPVRLRYALAKSINTVAIKVMHDVGPEAAVALAKQLGITGELPMTLSLALGSGEVTPLELTNAFASFAAGGVYAPPRFVAKIGGQPRPVAPGTQVVSPEVAYVITDMMRSVVEQGTAAKARSLGVTIAGKTGTSNDARDTWFIGMTPEVVIGVWVGNDDSTPMGNGEAGGVTALPAFIEVAKALGLKDRAFARPAGVEVQTIDLKTGLLAAAGAPATTTASEVFLKGTAPTEVAPLPGEIDATTFVTDEYGDEAPASALAQAPTVHSRYGIGGFALRHVLELGTAHDLGAERVDPRSDHCAVGCRDDAGNVQHAQRRMGRPIELAPMRFVILAQLTIAHGRVGGRDARPEHDEAHRRAVRCVLPRTPQLRIRYEHAARHLLE